MKKIFILTLLLLPLFTTAQNPNQDFNKLYKSVRLGKDVIKLKVPGFLVRTALKVSFLSDNGNPDFIDHVDMSYSELKPYINSIKGVRLVVAENPKKINTKKLKRSLDELRNDDFVDDLMQVKSDGTVVSMLVAENENEIRNLFVVVVEESETVFLNLKLKLDVAELDALLEAIVGLDSVRDVFVAE